MEYTEVENLENADQNEYKELQENSAMRNDTEIKRAEILQKQQLEDEIKNSKIFKTLMNSIDNRLPIDEVVSAIVENYLKMSPASLVINKIGGPLAINDTLINIAACEFIYLVSVIENGIVLNELGEVDIEATLEQRASMSYKKLSPEELLSLGSIVIQNQEDASNKDKLEKLLSSKVKDTVIHDTTNGFSKMYGVENSIYSAFTYLKDRNVTTEERKDAFEKISNSQEVKEEETDCIDKSFFATKREISFERLLLQAVEAKEKGKDRTFNSIIKKISKNPKYKEYREKLSELDYETIQKHVDTRQRAYNYKENKQEVDKFILDANMDYSKLSKHAKERLLLSMYDIATQYDSSTKTYILIAMKEINKDMIKTLEDGRETIDENVFLAELSAVNKKYKSIEDVEQANRRRNRKNYSGKMDTLYVDDSFTEINEINGETEEERKARQSKAKDEGRQKDFKVERGKTNKSTLERIVAQNIGENDKDLRSAIIAMAYARCREERNNGMVQNYLRDYILDHESDFNEYREIIFEGKKMSMLEQRVVASLKPEVREKLGEDPSKHIDSIIDAFQPLADYEKSIQSIKEKPDFGNVLRAGISFLGNTYNNQRYFAYKKFEYMFPERINQAALPPPNSIISRDNSFNITVSDEKAKYYQLLNTDRSKINSGFANNSKKIDDDERGQK